MSQSVSVMYFSSKPTKVKPKGTVRELKLVHSVNCRGAHTIKTEEVKTPKHNTLLMHYHSGSSSPIKHLKLDASHDGPILFHLEGSDTSKKRETLVCLLPLSSDTMPDLSQGKNDYLRQFLGHENLYLEHLLDLEIPPSDLTCITCGNFEAQFHCLDCYGQHWWCKSCIIKLHTHHPFHCPQHWKDGSFKNIALCDLGNVFILGHSSSGHSCPEDGNLFGDCRIMVIHLNGVFELCVRFC
jgi:hypothetical protein